MALRSLSNEQPREDNDLLRGLNLTAPGGDFLASVKALPRAQAEATRTYYNDVTSPAVNITALADFLLENTTLTDQQERTLYVIRELAQSIDLSQRVIDACDCALEQEDRRHG